jgi:colanic acid biosynthesis glycosyl transferase WcaI
MRVLLLTCDFPPVLKSAARIFFELAEDLSKYGHEVSVLTLIPQHFLADGEGAYRNRFLCKEHANGIKVWRTKNLPVPRHRPLARALEQIWMALVFYGVGRRLPRQDAVIVYSPPLPLGLAGYWLARRWEGVEIINVQDLYPQTAVDLGLLRNRRFIALAEKLEHFLYKKSDAITVHSEGNREYLLRKDAPSKHVHVINNWIDLEEVRPGVRENSWRHLHGLDDYFVVSFAGTMGFAQGLEKVLDAASGLGECKDILFVFAGDGVFAKSLEDQARDRDLRNVRFLPPQSAQAYIELLQASDVCLVTLHENLRTPVIPGKLQSVMATGRPVICCANPASDSRRLVKEAGCGFFIPNGEISKLTEAVLDLYKNRQMGMEMGRKGRSYAEVHFERKKCTQMYNHLILQLTGKAAFYDRLFESLRR